jgi:hypothetical protein
VVALLDPVIYDEHSGAPVGVDEHKQAARDAVLQLFAAVGPVLSGDMVTVRGRMEMLRRLRDLKAAAARCGAKA